MIKNIVFYIGLLAFFNFIVGCQTLRDGLEGNKRSKSAEEFLIEKKSPLILPPNYSELPEPKNSNDQVEKEEFDLQRIIGESNTNNNKNDEKKKSSVEKSIIEKIRNE